MKDLLLMIFYIIWKLNLIKNTLVIARQRKNKKGDKMKKILITAMAIVILFVTPAFAYCPLVYEYVDGWNRICVYECSDGKVAITIDYAALCPWSI